MIIQGSVSVRIDEVAIEQQMFKDKDKYPSVSTAIRAAMHHDGVLVMKRACERLGYTLQLSSTHSLRDHHGFQVNFNIRLMTADEKERGV